jgi:hypothetical protein
MTGEPKMTEMSKPAEILYRAFLDELRFAKQQQWTVTNCTLLLMGAAYALAKLIAKSPTFCERVAWCAVVAVVVVLGLLVLVDLEVTTISTCLLMASSSAHHEGRGRRAAGQHGGMMSERDRLCGC